MLEFSKHRLPNDNKNNDNNNSSDKNHNNCNIIIVYYSYDNNITNSRHFAMIFINYSGGIFKVGKSFVLLKIK